MTKFILRAAALVLCHALDLTLPPAKLLAQVGGIADELVASSSAA